MSATIKAINNDFECPWEAYSGVVCYNFLAGQGQLPCISWYPWYPLTPEIGDMGWKWGKQWKLWKTRKASKNAGFQQT